MLNPNCSEAVFRFRTTDPVMMQLILQSIADEVYASERDYYGEGKSERQIIPLFERAEDYDTRYGGKPSYSSEIWEKTEKERNDIWRKRDKGEITQEQALELYGKYLAKVDAEIYPNTLITACAGLGDQNAVITVHKDNFTLNIGNNDIYENKTGWTERVKELGVKVDEAEYDKVLMRMARDCTCGIEYGFGGPDGHYGDWEEDWREKEDEKDNS